MKEELSIKIGKEFIELYKLLKWSKVIETGSLAKIAVENGDVLLNGKVEIEKHQKVFPNDIVEYKEFKLNVISQ